MNDTNVLVVEDDPAIGANLQRALANGVQQILLADPGRKTFMQLADHCQDWYGAELLPWRLGKKTKAKGHLLVIHNRLLARPA